MIMLWHIITWFSGFARPLPRRGFTRELFHSADSATSDSSQSQLAADTLVAAPIKDICEVVTTAFFAMASVSDMLSPVSALPPQSAQAWAGAAIDTLTDSGWRAMSAVTLASCWRGTAAGAAAAHGEARLAASAPTSAAEKEEGLGTSSALAWSKAVGEAAVSDEGVEAPREAVASAAAEANIEGTKEEAMAEEEHKDDCAAPVWATNHGVRELAAVRPGEEEDGDVWAAVAAVHENGTVGWVTAAAEVEGERKKRAAPASEEVGEALEVWLRRSSFLLVMSSCSCIRACTHSQITWTMQTRSQCLTPTIWSWELTSNWSAIKLWRCIGAQKQVTCGTYTKAHWQHLLWKANKMLKKALSWCLMPGLSHEQGCKDA